MARALYGDTAGARRSGVCGGEAGQSGTAGARRSGVCGGEAGQSDTPGARRDDSGFFRRAGPGPAGHFRTSAHASPLFAEALATLVLRLDEALDHPAPLDLVDVGAGRGELLAALLAALPDPVTTRARAIAVEVAPRPAGLAGAVEWRATVPERVTGLLIATEWLDNVPLDIVEVDDAGLPRYLCADGRPGEPVEPVDAAWLARWWPVAGAPPGTRAEIGAPRDAAWASAVAAVVRGLALAVDYGHFADERPPFGTLTGYRGGREVEPVPDGSCDLTAAVALDSVARAARVPNLLLRQRDALRALGLDGTRPPLALAHRDPAGYVRALGRAGAVAELTDPDGLGGHWWLMQWI
jgi:SAM-dependent MidA family methyltransferase